MIDDRCFRATGDVVAVRETRSDGTTASTGDLQVGTFAVAYCDLECAALPEPFPTGLLNRMVD